MKNLQLTADKICLIRLLPCGGMSADWINKTFEDYFAHVFELKSLADAEFGNSARYQDLFRLRVITEPGG
jgi:hypothetical protein